MSPTIRDQILDYLGNNPSVTVTELAMSLNVTRQDIRYHLKPLLDAQLVEKTSAGSTSTDKGRGRPATRLRITDKSHPNNYPKLVSSLLNYFLTKNNGMPSEKAALLAKMVFNASAENTSGLMQALINMVQILNQNHYQSHWEAHSAGPRVIFENCPYAQILGDFPQLCEMDSEFLSQATGMKTEMLQRFDTSSRKPPACIFRLTSSPI